MLATLVDPSSARAWPWWRRSWKRWAYLTSRIEWRKVGSTWTNYFSMTRMASWSRSATARTSRWSHFPGNPLWPARESSASLRSNSSSNSISRKPSMSRRSPAHEEEWSSVSSISFGLLALVCMVFCRQDDMASCALATRFVVAIRPRWWLFLSHRKACRNDVVSVLCGQAWTTASCD